MTAGSDGMVNSLGAGAILLEEFDSALKRRVKIHAEVKGFSTTIQSQQSAQTFDSKTI